MAARPPGAAAGAGTISWRTPIADIIVGVEVNPNSNSGIKQRWVDQLDGTWAPKVATTGGGGGGGGDASAANQTTQITAANLTNTELGALTETAPASDTAS